LDIDRIRQ
jgi:hypothetical protein